MIGRRAAGIGAMGCMAVALAPAPAHADTYRYWSYWTGGDQWTYSSRGPAFRTPADGAVEGWRFVVSPRDGSQASPPSPASSYDQLCPGSAPAPAGQKRVAVVIDFGSTGIAPVGETTPPTSTTCVTVPASANGLQVLQRGAELRFHSSGLICGIAGFPAKECPGQSTTPSSSGPVPTRTPTSVPPDPVTVPPAGTDLPDPVETDTPARTSTGPTATTAPPASDTPTPVALAMPESSGPPADSATPPAWIAAIGATMIAALLGLAILARRGRE